MTVTISSQTPLARKTFTTFEEKTVGFTITDRTCYLVSLPVSLPAGGPGTQCTLDTNGPSVEQFTIIDANGNFHAGSDVTIIVGTDTVRLSKPGRYDFVRVGFKFHVYALGRKVGEAII